MSSPRGRRERATSFSPVWLGRKSVISTPNTRRRLQRGRAQRRRSGEAARGAKGGGGTFSRRRGRLPPPPPFLHSSRRSLGRQYRRQRSPSVLHRLPLLVRSTTEEAKNKIKYKNKISAARHRRFAGFGTWRLRSFDCGRRGAPAAGLAAPRTFIEKPPKPKQSAASAFMRPAPSSRRHSVSLRGEKHVTAPMRGPSPSPASAAAAAIETRGKGSRQPSLVVRHSNPPSPARLPRLSFSTAAKALTFGRRSVRSPEGVVLRLEYLPVLQTI